MIELDYISVQSIYYIIVRNVFHAKTRKDIADSEHHALSMNSKNIEKADKNRYYKKKFSIILL